MGSDPVPGPAGRHMSHRRGRLREAAEAITGPWDRRNGVSWLKLLLLVLVLKWTVIELYSIPSGSMEPVLHGDPRFFRGDRVAVNKFLFGPRIPFTTTRIFRISEPKRWDIVVFNAVDPEAEHPILIKRIVGLPGERIRIAEGGIFVNGERVRPPEGLQDVLHYTTQIVPQDDIVRRALVTLAERRALPPSADPNRAATRSLAEDIEEIRSNLPDTPLEEMDDETRKALTDRVRPEGFELVRQWLAAQYTAERPFRYGIREEDEFSLVPEGHYFLLGDNSENSADGRYFGWVPHQNLYGRAFAVVLPFSRMTDLTGFSDTWWGKVLLFGLPGALALFELSRAFFLLPWRIRAEDEVYGLASGDRVWINRMAFGLRIPFTRRSIRAQRPRYGELIAYLPTHPEEGARALRFDHVGDSPHWAKPNDVVMKGEALQSDRIVGKVVAVWWPLSRVRRITLPMQ